MVWTFSVFILAFILIMKGGDLLVESAIWFAKKTKMPSVVVGATIVALATTFPEISVSIMSGMSGAETLAINTATGSMVCNFALVLGLSFLIFPTTVNSAGLKHKVVYFLFSLCVLLLVSLDGRLSKVDMGVLFVVFVAFMIFNVIEARRGENNSTIASDIIPNWGAIVFQFVISAFAIGFGANVLVDNVDELSEILGISEGLVGTFIIAVGTNIPEFVTTLTAIKLKDSMIGVGNIFGASIIDATFLIGVTILSSKSGDVFISRDLMFLTFPILLLITGIIALPILKSEKSNRVQGLLLVILFVIYSLFLAKIS